MLSGGRHSARSFRSGGGPPPPPPATGTRRAALRGRRRNRRRRAGIVAAAAVVVLALAAATVVAARGPNGSSGDETSAAPAAPVRDEGVATLLFGTTGDRVVWLTLLSYDRDRDRGAVVYIPAHTAVEIPGRGLLGVADSYQSGGAKLLVSSVETMLGADVDTYLELSGDDAEAVMAALGPVDVEIPAEVRVGAGGSRTRLLLSEGLQRVEASDVRTLLYTLGTDGDDVELGGRHLAFWHALLESFEARPGDLRRAMRAASGALTDSDGDAADHTALVAALVSAGGSGRTFETLPVRQVSVGGSELYATNEDEVAEFVDGIPGVAARPATGPRIQLLNGNGGPGVGEAVARKLIGRGYRIVLSGNARRLDYPATRIIVYGDDAAARAAGEHVRELLGVGKVQVSRQQQGIVDLTIIVGRDWLRTR